MSSSFLRLSTVKARTGLSRTTVYRRVQQGAFPAPCPLGGRSVGWLDSDIEEWIAKQALARRTSGKQ